MKLPPSEVGANRAPPLHIAYLTAGAAGMFCGSCMHDNTLARALIALGHDVQLVPLYTPIRTDEADVSLDRVFFGGINIYLKQKYAWYRRFPQWMTRWLDSPRLITWSASLGIETKASQLGALTVAMLRGSEDFQLAETDRLADWLQASDRPDIVVFSNMLTAGIAPRLKRRLRTPIVVTLQGDDIFLDDLVEPFKSQAFAEIGRLDATVDGYLTHSEYYADHMSSHLGLPREKFRVVPLGLDVADYEQVATRPATVSSTRPPTIGYLARLAPEKGLHVLADAFIELRKRRGTHDARLRIAGWLGPQHRKYVHGIFAKLDAAGLQGQYEHVGEVDRHGKLAFLQSIDALAVPTVYREPKGLFVLEAIAAGVPVVQPDHGSFPETIADVGGGLLHRPEDASHLADRLHELLSDRSRLGELAAAGQQAVHTRRSARAMAEQTSEVLSEFVHHAASSRDITAEPRP